MIGCIWQSQIQMRFSCKTHLPLLLQDPSYDPYAFAKVATRSASSEGGSAPACAANVRKFFQTIMSDNHTTSGLQQINNAMSLCSESQVESASDVLVLANYVLYQWVSAVSPLYTHLLCIGMHSGHAQILRPILAIITMIFPMLFREVHTEAMKCLHSCANT